MAHAQLNSSPVELDLTTSDDKSNFSVPLAVEVKEIFLELKEKDEQAASGKKHTERRTIAKNNQRKSQWSDGC